MDYRRDNRTKKEFANDIIECTNIERKLMEYYVQDLNKRKPRSFYTFSDNGVDNSGKLIKDDTKVNTNADFFLKKHGKPDRKIEIKFCRQNFSVFHLKTSQLRSYIKQNCCIVMFMGIDTPDIRYTVIKPDDMQNIIDFYKDVFLWGKDQKKLPVKDFNWFKINV